MTMTLKTAKELKLDGSAIVRFSGSDIVWKVTGRYPDDEYHPEKVRVLVENAERGQSYFTETMLERVSLDGDSTEKPVTDAPKKKPVSKKAK